MVVFGQIDQTDELYLELKAYDSLLFQIGFNTCDIDQFVRFMHDDLEFYHDQSGITDSKASFIDGTKNGLCNLDYQPIRKLDESSLQLFPLKNNGELYGALQTGIHHFYAKYPGKEEYLTSSARFSHLWKLEAGRWQVYRVISYDHQSP